MQKPCDIPALLTRIRTVTGKSAQNGAPLSAGVKPSRQEQSLESLVTEIIHEIGVPAHIKGYQYLREAIILAINDMEIIKCRYKSAVPTVARKSQRRRAALNARSAMPSRLRGQRRPSKRCRNFSVTRSRI